MKIGIPKEITGLEKRVAATPETVKRMITAGLEVVVESGAGHAASFPDADYKDAGAQLAENAGQVFAESDILLKVRKPLEGELDLLKEGQVLVALLQVLSDHGLAKELAARKVTALSMDTIPRIARAQKLDALSSQSNVAGYKAVLMAANAVGKMMPMMMTAAGTISPAKVLIIGAGVAGLQAVATAKRLGAVVEVFDIRAAAKEQVESLGGKFISVDLDDDAEDSGGYAKELSQDAHELEQALITKHALIADIVVTTALIPGRAAPILITAETIRGMKEGSVVVDLAAEGGGNCELTEQGKDVVKDGVLIMGPLNIPSLMAAESSRLYARNVMNLIFEFYKEGKFELNREDEIVRGALITHEGKVVHPAVEAKLNHVGGAS